MNRWGDFELLEEIGRGSFGTVYRANHPTLQQQVALKLGLSPHSVHQYVKQLYAQLEVNSRGELLAQWVGKF